MPRELVAPGVGNGRVDAADPFTLIDGTSGVTDIVGVSFTAIEGMEGVTDIAGGVTLLVPLEVGLTEIDGVSCTEIVGMGGMALGLERAGGVWETFIVGIDAGLEKGAWTFLDALTLGRGLFGGSP
jgi:hypothetical protein